MAVTVKFFAVLREYSGKPEKLVTFEQGMTVTDAWALSMNGEVMPDNVMVAVNMEYTKPGASLQDGDEVAFFPSVTGG